MPVSDAEAAEIADAILAAGDAATPIPPVTDRRPQFDLADAYRVSALITERRIARGERPIGWKVGFTNRTIWDEYGVHAPIWGPMYSSTLAEVDPAAGPLTCPVKHLAEPRIEPEIALRLGSSPSPEMDDGALLGCVEGVAHGIEVVQSVFPGWVFKASDTVAAFALHGCYRLGPVAPIGAGDRQAWQGMLAAFSVRLSCNGEPVDEGIAANVLGGGPLAALRHFVRGLAETPGPRALKPGDIVTTGTVTRAFPVAPGERWQTEIGGLPLPGLTVDFT
jgi:2-keto-4-pentenoate hydratase